MSSVGVSLTFHSLHSRGIYRPQPQLSARYVPSRHSHVVHHDKAPLSDVVWPESKQIGLIDSIFRNFYVPPVIFAVQKDEDGETVRVCVDGKQRLTSIQKFLDGLVSLPAILYCLAY